MTVLVFNGEYNSKRKIENETILEKIYRINPYGLPILFIQ